MSRYDRCNTGQLVLAASFLAVLNDLTERVQMMNVINCFGYEKNNT